ncbi:MAG: hypothetical protein M3336_07730 [Chloroflexota bacterium]|nr:hypothetical protein [Chloroflexota bacterium]
MLLDNTALEDLHTPPAFSVSSLLLAVLAPFASLALMALPLLVDSIRHAVGL